MASYDCHVCEQHIEPDAYGRIRFEGVTEAPRGKAWVWGPVAVHEDCRMGVVTPYDDKIGDGYVLTWQRVTV
jgi:hypothetical protein